MCMCVCVYVCMIVCVFMCVYDCVFMCVCVCVCVHVCVLFVHTMRPSTCRGTGNGSPMCLYIILCHQKKPIYSLLLSGGYI